MKNSRANPLEKWLDGLGKTRYAMSKETGISQVRLHEFVRHKKTPTLIEYALISNYVNLAREEVENMMELSYHISRGNKRQAEFWEEKLESFLTGYSINVLNLLSTPEQQIIPTTEWIIKNRENVERVVRKVVASLMSFVRNTHESGHEELVLFPNSVGPDKRHHQAGVLHPSV